MRLLWLDLETTGLDPSSDGILEVAACVADLEHPFTTRNPYEAVLPFHLDKHVDDIHPVVIDMHTKNGLWKACETSRLALADVERALIAMAGETPSSDRNNQTTFAGSCVGFDHEFIKRRMPKLASFLHYRVYDVSSILLFCRSLGMPKPPKVEAHRAMADVKESIENARRCAEWLGRAR